MTEEMNRMVGVFLANGHELRKRDNDKYYLAPNIPPKVFEKLRKYFDNHLSVNSLVAFYDSTILGSCKNGLLFTNDGMYYCIKGKPIYIHYADIIEMNCTNDNLEIKLKSREMSDIIISGSFDMQVLKKTLRWLVSIDEGYEQSSSKKSGEVKEIDLPPEMLKKCKETIHVASAACGSVGTGLAQIPLSDNAVIVPIQIAMIIRLGVIFEINVTESIAKGIIASASATVAGRTFSQVLVGWIPGIGNVINTATAAGVTEAIGWIAVKTFYDGRIEDKNKERCERKRDRYTEAKKEGYAEASAESERKAKNQADQFNNERDNIKKAIDEYERILDEYENCIANLEKKLDAAQKENVKVKKELNDGQKYITDLEKKLDAEQKENAELKKKLTDVQKHNVELEKRNNDQQEYIAELEKKISEMKIIYNGLQDLKYSISIRS